MVSHEIQQRQQGARQRLNPGIAFLSPMLTNRYRYELRHQEKTLVTGHLSREEQLQIGDRIEIAGSLGIVRSIDPVLGEQELRLVVELLRSPQP